MRSRRVSLAYARSSRGAHALEMAGLYLALSVGEFSLSLVWREGGGPLSVGGEVLSLSRVEGALSL